jgi:hypothetical protein
MGDLSNNKTATAVDNQKSEYVYLMKKHQGRQCAVAINILSYWDKFISLFFDRSTDESLIPIDLL